MSSGRWALAIVFIGAAECVFVTGCMLPYAYPKLDYVPGCDPACPKAAEVHAFRVDVGADQIDLGENGKCKFTEITPRPDGSIPPQARLSLEFGYYVCGPLNFNVGRLHGTRVRLYSPGYDLIEIAAWESINEVVWVAARDLAAQEKAIDQLLACPTLTEHPASSKNLSRSFWGEGKQLTPIMSNSPLPKTFLFAAAEYERVAASAHDEKDAARLHEKANWLKNPMRVDVWNASFEAEVEKRRSTPKSP